MGRPASRWFSLILLALVLLSQAAAAQEHKQPTLYPGRVHLTDGSVRAGQLQLVDCDQVDVTGTDGVAHSYSPDEVSSFVMGIDSFTVLRDFYITLTRDAEHYNKSFMRVCAAGAGVELYEFRGSMTRNQNGGSNVGAVVASSALRVASGGITPMMLGGRPEKIVMTTAWLLRRDGNPRWLTLPTGARNLREVIEPIVADDKELVVQWPIRPVDVPAVLSQYVAHKTSKGKL